MRATAYVLGGALIAGTLDIVYAWAFWRLKAGVSMTRILQSIAAGLLGRNSFEGGAATALLGLGLHFFIATTMAFCYYVVSGHWRLLVQRPLLWGAAYGILLYAIMNAIVLPLSAAGPGPRDRLWVVLTIVVHMAFIGIPIALAAERARRRR
jgi:hypothetical protein